MGFEDNGGAMPLPSELVAVQDVVAHLYTTRGLDRASALNEIGTDTGLRLFGANSTMRTQKVPAAAEYWFQEPGRRILSRALSGGGCGNSTPEKRLLGRGPRGLLALMAANANADWSAAKMLLADATRRFGYGEVPSAPAKAPSASVLALVTAEDPGKSPRSDDSKIIQPEGHTWPLQDKEPFTDAHKEAAFEMRHKNKVSGDDLQKIVGRSRQAIDKHIGGATVLKTNQWGKITWRPSEELLKRCGIAPTGLQSTAAALTKKPRKSA